MRLIGIVNTGNAESVARALSAVGTEHAYVNDPSCFDDFDALVMPGQGSISSIPDGVKSSIGAFIKGGGKYLGICLGLQLLYRWSDEGLPIEGSGLGLSVINGTVKRLPRARIGWEAVDSERGWFYFCHRYSGGIDVFRNGRVTGVQFHPEKSGKDGLRWLAEWVRS